MRSLLKTGVSLSLLALTVSLSACGGGGSANAQTPPPSPPVTPPVTTGCVAGTWTVVSGTPEEQAVQYETDHFAFRWKAGDVNRADAVAAGEYLEMVWKLYMGPVAFPEPYCDTAAKKKANINLDPSFGLSGGPTGERDMGMWIAPPALKDHWGLSHEFTHALQGSTRSLRDGVYTGWLWESHANWMSHQMPEYRGEVHCSELLVNFPHLYYGSTRDRYCNWQFLEYLKDKYGYAAVSAIWAKGLKPGEPGYMDESFFTILMRTQKWSVADLNDEFGEWAMRNVTWDYVDDKDNDQGPVYRAKYGSYDDKSGIRPLRTTSLEPLDLGNRRFAVPALWAPQRYGYNLVRLMPDAGATKVSVRFRGVVQTTAGATMTGLNNEPASVPAPASDWRWGIVAVQADGTPRYSPLMGGADGDLAFDLKVGDTAVYMVVVGTPTAHHPIMWDQAYYSIYRFPWMAQFSGAMPQGFEAGAAKPTADGHVHPNGGGWVGKDAKVDASVYVGPYAQVLGGTVKDHARIEDHAIVRSGTISGDAVVGGMSIIDNNVVIKDKAVVRTTFMGIGAFEPGTELSGTAQIWGDAEVRGGPKLNKGVYTGFVDQASQDDPKQGGDLTAPAPEVTSFTYTWRP
ncbi:avirulence protein [Asticcacaulis sp. AC460]|uniref:Svx/AvrXca family virulence/avirulence protein n=1 Tax=Asticcacaulis sp. AC460 TaxID=1282360 RepID=UPI0003C4063B|nr:Svx/AvrXca family virulence/avirulence protein [Asticcacaulis sp. AC460]ESQ86528.1 avirulence protein [Asticcacaulis sp. AC460]